MAHAKGDRASRSPTLAAFEAGSQGAESAARLGLSTERHHPLYSFGRNLNGLLLVAGPASAVRSQLPVAWGLVNLMRTTINTFVLVSIRVFDEAPARFGKSLIVYE